MQSFLKSRSFLWIMIIGANLFILVLLVAFGVMRPVTMPTSSMAPTIPSNSIVTMERLTYWFRNPTRGEIVTFKTDGIPGLPQQQIYLKRVIGLPNEHLMISNGFLFINSHPVIVTNQYGPIVIHPLPGLASSANIDLTIPTNSYFVIGDNTSNSFDSRMFGPVPRTNILGLVTP